MDTFISMEWFGICDSELHMESARETVTPNK